MSSGTPAKSAENSNESRTRRSIDASQQLTSGCGRLVGHDGWPRRRAAQGVVETDHGGLSVMDLLVDGLGGVAVLRRESGNACEQLGVARMAVVWGVSAALANHGGVGEPNRLAVSLPAATVSEVN